MDRAICETTFSCRSCYSCLQGNAEAEAALESARDRLRLSMRLHQLREREGLTQKEVAERAGTKRSVIARLESSGYEKHTLSTLHRVARALGYGVKVEFVRLRKTQSDKATGDSVRAGPKGAVNKASGNRTKAVT